MGPGLRSEIWGTRDLPKCYLKVEIEEIPCLTREPPRPHPKLSRSPRSEQDAKTCTPRSIPKNSIVETARDQRKAPSLPSHFPFQLGGEAQGAPPRHQAGEGVQLRKPKVPRCLLNALHPPPGGVHGPFKARGIVGAGSGILERNVAKRVQ